MLEIKDIDTDTFHLIFIGDKSESEIQDFFTFLDSLMARPRFGLLLETDTKKSFSMENKKRLSHWFKTNKPKIKKGCFGLARINKSSGIRARLARTVIQLAYPCPYFVASDSHEAIDWLKKKSRV